MTRILVCIVGLSTLFAGFLWCAAVIDRQDASRERGLKIIDKVEAIERRLSEWEKADAEKKAKAENP